MKDEAKVLVADIKEVMDEYVKQMDWESIKNIDPNSFALMQKSMKLMDKACDYYVAEAGRLDEIDRKLDLLLAQKEVAKDFKL